MSNEIGLVATVTGAERVDTHLTTVAAVTRARIRAAVDRLAITVQQKAEGYLHGPRPEHLGVVTGRLSGSVNVQPFDTATEIGAATGTNVEYGKHWELGFQGLEQVSAHVRKTASRDVFDVSRTASGALAREKVGGGVAFVKAHPRQVNDAPRPFLMPALDDVRPTARDAIEAAVHEALR